MDFGSHVWRGGMSIHTAILNRVESKAFSLVNYPPLTNCFYSIGNRINVASLFIFYRYFHVGCSFELINCMPSCGLDAQDYLFLLITILSIFLMQELTSIFILSFLTLINSRTFFLCLFPPFFFYKNSFKREVLRHP